MYILYNWSGILSSIKETWIPAIIPLGILFIIFIIIAILRKEK